MLERDETIRDELKHIAGPSTSARGTTRGHYSRPVALSPSLKFEANVILPPPSLLAPLMMAHLNSHIASYASTVFSFLFIVFICTIIKMRRRRRKETTIAATMTIVVVVVAAAAVGALLAHLVGSDLCFIMSNMLN